MITSAQTSQISVYNTTIYPYFLYMIIIMSIANLDISSNIYISTKHSTHPLSYPLLNSVVPRPVLHFCPSSWEIPDLPHLRQRQIRLLLPDQFNGLLRVLLLVLLRLYYPFSPHHLSHCHSAHARHQKHSHQLEHYSRLLSYH